MNLGDDFEPTKIEVDKLNLPSKWILTKLNKVISNFDYNMEKYEFGEAARLLYSFVWDDFASWYVEISKVDLANNDINALMTKNVLLYVLKAIIKLLHPFIPFITEEIYQTLPHNHKSITISNWPTVVEEYNDNTAFEAIENLAEIITSIRNERAKANKAPKEPIDVYIYSSSINTLNEIKLTEKYLIKFINPKKLEFISEDISSNDYSITVLKMAKIYIPIIMTLNTYELAALNGWDGTSVEVGDDYIMTPQEALEYGMIDKVITKE